MSAPSPWDRSPLDEPEVDPAGRRRRAAVTAGVVVGAVVLAIVVFMAASRSGGNKMSLPLIGVPTTTTNTTPPASTTTSTVGSTPANPAAVAPIHVDVVVGTVVIAGHMACAHEDELTGDSLAEVEAAVAADNNGTSGGTATPYAHDAAAQNEIVRASVQQLHSTHRFYADCRPVSTSAKSESQAAGGTETPTATNSDTGTPAASTPSLPPSR
jgi:hypothetical protein